MKTRIAIDPSLLRASEPPVSNGRLAMILFVASEAMLFASLIAGYVVLQGGSGGFMGMDRLPFGLAGFGVSTLLGSSVALVIAQRAIVAGQLGRFRAAAVLTLVMGILFLALQLLEWDRLVEAGLVPDKNVYNGLFYALSGVHGLHVLGGLVLLAVMVAKALRGGVTSGRRGIVSVAAIYWHFVTIVWLALFLMIFVF